MKTIPRRVMRVADVEAATGYKATQRDQLIAGGKFPASFKLSPGGRAVGWWEDEIITWQQAREAERVKAIAAKQKQKAA